MKAEKLLENIKEWDINEDTFDSIVLNLIKQFKKEICEKQREICARKAEVTSDYLPSKDELQYIVEPDSILNAPEPN